MYETLSPSLGVKMRSKKNKLEYSLRQNDRITVKMVKKCLPLLVKIFLLDIVIRSRLSSGTSSTTVVLMEPHKKVPFETLDYNYVGTENINCLKKCYLSPKN